MDFFCSKNICQSKLKISFSKESEILGLGSSIEREILLTIVEALNHAPT